MTNADRDRQLLSGIVDSISADQKAEHIVYVDRFIPPWPEPPPRVVVREVYALWGFPWWLVAIWLLAVGFMLGLWTGIYH